MLEEQDFCTCSPDLKGVREKLASLVEMCSYFPIKGTMPKGSKEIAGGLGGNHPNHKNLISIKLQSLLKGASNPHLSSPGSGHSFPPDCL